MVDRFDSATEAPIPFVIISRDREIQDLYVIALGCRGISAIGLSNVDDVCTHAERDRVGAVLFDVDWLSDWDLVCTLRGRLPRNVPIVVLTGWVRSDGCYRKLARTIGCAAFLAKPCHPAVIAETLLLVLQGSPWIERVDDCYVPADGTYRSSHR